MNSNLFRIPLLLGTFLALYTCALFADEYQPPRLSSEENWTIAIVPDPQTYTKLTRNQGIIELMTAWLAEQAQPLKIQQVLVVGDLVGYNGIEELRPGINDQTGDQQWQAISRAFLRLDGKVPYALCTGNHDYGILSAENRETKLNDHFPIERIASWNKHLIACGNDAFGQPTITNAVYEFTAPNGRKMLTLALPFAPTDDDIAWAKQFVNRPEYQNHFVILLTHSYINASGEHIAQEKYVLNQQGGNAGLAIWEKLVKVSPNIRMVVCGHISKPDYWPGGVAFSVVENDAGKEVYQMLFNTQSLGGGWHGNGGDGWLRLLEISPNLDRVKAITFSPLFAISPSTRHLAYNREDFNAFEFEIKE